jgi:hypothetical protein
MTERASELKDVEIVSIHTKDSVPYADDKIHREF